MMCHLLSGFEILKMRKWKNKNHLENDI